MKRRYDKGMRKEGKRGKGWDLETKIIKEKGIERNRRGRKGKEGRIKAKSQGEEKE